MKAELEKAIVFKVEGDPEVTIVFVGDVVEIETYMLGNTACVHNIACECMRQEEIRISEGYCMDSEDSGNTGEVIEIPLSHNVWDQQMPNYKVPTAYENLQTQTTYKTEDIHERY